MIAGSQCPSLSLTSAQFGSSNRVHGSSMSWLGQFQNLTERFGKPFRKRHKLGEDEDDWCDALNDLHMDSSSSDEYVDAQEEQVPINPSSKGIKRKKTKSKKENKKLKSSGKFGNLFPSVSTFATSRGIERTPERHPTQPQEEQTTSNLVQTRTMYGRAGQTGGAANTSRERERTHSHAALGQTSSARGHGNIIGRGAGRGSRAKGSKERSESTGYPFTRKDCSKPSFAFASGSNTAATTSSVVVEPMETQGGLTDAKLCQVAASIGDNVDTIRQLGIYLGFSYNQISRYYPHGITVDSSGTMRMLQDWKHKTSEEQQMPGLLAALKNSGLYSVADKLYIKEDLSAATTKYTGQIASSAGYKAATSSSFSAADYQTEAQSGNKGPTHPDKTSQESQMDKGGITDRQLEQLADDLDRDTVDYSNVRSLGKQLGFSLTDVFDYCRYEKQKWKGSSGIMRMLRAWRSKTFESQQVPGLIEALKRANLPRLAADLHRSKEVVDDPTDSKRGNRQGSTSIDNLPQQEAPLKSDTDKGRISDNELDKLVKALFGDEYDKSRSLGLKLGFNSTKISDYFGYGKQKDNSGILCMLHAWRLTTPDPKQRRGLFEALKEAKLQHLAGGRILPIPRKRKVTVTLMTSSQFVTIEGLKNKLETLKKSRRDLINEVRILQLPYSRIQFYEFTEQVDIMILCHSIENRRFAITNVTDSLYDEFLDYCYKKLGKEKIIVVAHDFPPEAKEVREVKMDSFKHTQWTTFEKAGLVMICGMMDKNPEMREEDWTSLVRFLEAASKLTQVKESITDDTSPPLPGEKDGRDCKPEPNISKASKPQTTKSTSFKPLKMISSVPGLRVLRSRKPIIYLCTSWGFHSVIGFKEKLQTLLKRSYPGYEVREQKLPYSCLDDFKFSSEVCRPDAMILCHSMYNRGFSITDVPNSIYDEYLYHCSNVFGKDHVAVIVHDFEYTEEILRIHMDTFQRAQPKTFQLAGFVALARKLDVANVQLSQEDSIKLEKFVEKLR